MPKEAGQAIGRPPTGASGSAAGRRTRDALLRATVSAIASSGWAAITTRQVAALAGVNQALVHYHFGSMDELRRQALAFALSSELEAPMAALLADQPLASAIAAGVESVCRIDTATESFAFLCEAMLAGGRDPVVRAFLADALLTFRATFADRVRAAGGASPDAAAVLVAATLDGLLLHRLVMPDVEPAGLADSLVAAIRLPDEPHAAGRAHP